MNPEKTGLNEAPLKYVAIQFNPLKANPLGRPPSQPPTKRLPAMPPPLVCLPSGPCSDFAYVSRCRAGAKEARVQGYGTR
jgi:hypothetical protein